jgi:two-component system OmpR family response regulator
MRLDTDFADHVICRRRLLMEETAPEQILVVNAERSLRDGLATAVPYETFAVEESRDGPVTLLMMHASPTGLIVLDAALSRLEGYEATRRLRADGVSVPIPLLTAKEIIQHRINWYTVGEDGYAYEPFALAELVARINCIVRRAGKASTNGARLRYGGIEIDEDAHAATRAGHPILRIGTGFNLIRFILLNRGRVLSKSMILNHVWHYDLDGGTNVVETYGSHLHKNFGAIRSLVIHTVRTFWLENPRQRKPCL